VHRSRFEDRRREDLYELLEAQRIQDSLELAKRYRLRSDDGYGTQLTCWPAEPTDHPRPRFSWPKEWQSNDPDYQNEPTYGPRPSCPRLKDAVLEMEVKHKGSIVPCINIKI